MSIYNASKLNNENQDYYYNNLFKIKVLEKFKKEILNPFDSLVMYSGEVGSSGGNNFTNDINNNTITTETPLLEKEEQEINEEKVKIIPNGFEEYKDILELDPFSFPNKREWKKILRTQKRNPEKLTEIQKQQLDVINRINKYFKNKIEESITNYENNYRMIQIKNKFNRYWRKTSPQEKIYRFQTKYNFYNFKGIYPEIFRNINFVNGKGEIQLTPEIIEQLTNMSPSKSIIIIDRKNFTTYVFENQKLQKTFPNGLGRLSGIFDDKTKEGDETTPIGIYDVKSIHRSKKLGTTGVFINYPLDAHKKISKQLFGSEYYAGGGIALHKPKHRYDLFNKKEIKLRSLSCIHVPNIDTVRYIKKQFRPTKKLKKANPDISNGGIVVILPEINTDMYKYKTDITSK